MDPHSHDSPVSAITPDTVLAFWFEDDETGRMDLPQSKRWFRGGETLDRTLTERFSGTLDKAMQGELDHWQDSAEGTLALILLLDQFSRNIHRGSARAFEGDARALALCHHAIDRGYIDALPLTQQVFAYLPLEHDESAASQEHSVAVFTALRDKAPSELKDFAEGTLDFAHQHKAIIDRFGRYPYRNAVLGRTNTSEEAEWLAKTSKRFGQ